MKRSATAWKGAALAAAVLSTLVLTVPAHAASTSASTATSKELALKGVTLDRNDHTRFSYEFQGKAGRTYDLYLGSDAAQTRTATKSAPSHCVGSWCKVTGTVTLRTNELTAPVAFSTRGTRDIISLQVWDPYSFPSMYELLTGNAGTDGANARLTQCAGGYDWRNWQAYAADRSAFKAFYDRSNSVGKVLITAVALNAINQEWQGANRTKVVDSVARRVAKRVDDIAHREFGTYDWRDFLPSRQQMGDAAKAIASQRLDTDGICRRHGH